MKRNLNQPFLASAVNVIDSIIITSETNPELVYAEWTAQDSDITVYQDLTAMRAVRLVLNWSDKNGTIPLQQGDYFTFVIPDIFNKEYITDVTSANITDEAGNVVATYSIYTNTNNLKEVRVVFTDYVDTRSNISGDFWLLLFVGRVTATEEKYFEFIINNELAATGEITVNPGTGSNLTPVNSKSGFSSPSRIVDDFYIFEWNIYINMDENELNGFNTLTNFSFEDIIPSNSPHVFLTDEIREQFGITGYQPMIGEYTGADSIEPINRYQFFKNQYNSSGSDIWYSYINWHQLVNGLTTVGIDGDTGLNVSDIIISDKMYSATLGNLTRPATIRFYTISTIKITESALGDTEVVGLFKDIFTGNYNENLSSSLTLFRFTSGGSAQGIRGEYSFSFTKVGENGESIKNVMYALYTSDDFSLGADRIGFSDSMGVVSFKNLPEGTYYMFETIARYGYIQDTMIYKVVLTSDGFEIYYGENFEKKLSDQGNKIINRSEFEIHPVSVTLTGTKKLYCKELTDSMFSFIVTDSDHFIVAAGANDAEGNIKFSEIIFDEPGIYVFTVSEVRENINSMIYDGTETTVVVTVTSNGSGNLEAEVSYINGGITFKNKYCIKPKKEKCRCCHCNPCRCRPCC